MCQSVLTSSLFRFLKVRALSKVDLPAPEAPMMATSSPGFTNPLAEHKRRRQIAKLTKNAREQTY